MEQVLKNKRCYVVLSKKTLLKMLIYIEEKGGITNCGIFDLKLQEDEQGDILAILADRQKKELTSYLRKAI